MFNKQQHITTSRIVDRHCCTHSLSIFYTHRSRPESPKNDTGEGAGRAQPKRVRVHIKYNIVKSFSLHNDWFDLLKLFNMYLLSLYKTYLCGKCVYVCYTSVDLCFNNHEHWVLQPPPTLRSYYYGGYFAAGRLTVRTYVRWLMAVGWLYWWLSYIVSLGSRFACPSAYSFCGSIYSRHFTTIPSLWSDCI